MTAPETNEGSARPGVVWAGKRKVPMRSHLILLSLTLLLLLPVSVAAAQAGGHEISNDQVLLRLDGAGRIAELANRQTGHSYITAPGKAPWRMFYRLGSGYYRPGDAVDIEIAPDDQRPSVRKEGNSLLIRYESLTGQTARRGETKRLAIGLTLRALL